ncbi:Large T antigen [Araneus ventricosus]|uniref:Large T antigen n=1 Tax=Araneus ventricosus TaxID=182803 RepID=A0A4Y2PVE5_ARAVE|nr:Large T antigen [Araneus ventricosus]
MASGDLKETKESVFRCESQKDKNCNLENCINELCRILGCNISELTYKELSSLVKKRSISLRPQNNETNPRKEFLSEQLKELEEVWQIYKTLRPGCSHDESSGSEEEFQEGGEDSYADNTGYSEEFFKISPEKQYDFPEFMKVFFRSESCRRAGKQIIVCVPNKSFVKEAFVLHFLPWDHLSVFIHSDVTIISILLCADHRYFDIRKCVRSKIDNFKINFCIRYAKMQDVLLENCSKAIYEFGDYIKKEKSEDKSFSSFLLSEYAKQKEITNVYELMSAYAHFSNLQCSFKIVTDDHREDHETHFENAKKYVQISDRKRFAKNAVEVVKAEMFMSFKTVTNLEFLESKAIELCNELMKNDEDFQESVSHALFFKNVICSDPEVKSKYFKMFKFILKSFNFGDPKERYTALTGGFNCGKTSIGFAFLTLFSGTSINCNVDFGRIGFFLGEAINQRFILFDDVSKKGMKNLDELRDHLDGRVPVLLEKKNMQPLLQKFPAGIITSNLSISSNLHVRVREFTLEKFNLQEHEYKMNSNVLFIILVMWNLIPAESYFFKEINNFNCRWRKEHVVSCALCKNFDF